MATAPLRSGERLMTPFEMTASKLASSKGSSSMWLSVNSTCEKPQGVPEPGSLGELRVGDVHPHDAA